MDKKVKLLVLLLNKMGVEVNYTTVSKYSEKFDSMITTYTLTFWYKKEVMDKNTGEMVLKSFPVLKEFTRMADLVKYLMAVREDKTKAGK